MTISGVSNNSYMNYSSYRVTNGTDEVSTSTTDTQQAGKAGRPDGPPPPRGGKGGMKGPDLDTDSNGEWNEEELETFASYASSEMGVDIDTDEILSTYDVDEDGVISSSEQVALGKDNAFDLPSPKDMMQQMRGFSQAPNIQTASVTAIDNSSDSNSNTSIIQSLIDAYELQNQTMYDEVMNSSLVT